MGMQGKLKTINKAIWIPIIVEVGNYIQQKVRQGSFSS